MFKRGTTFLMDTREIHSMMEAPLDLSSKASVSKWDKLQVG